MAGSASELRTLTAADAGRRLAAHVGDLLVVHLEETPTTGYRWKVDHVDDRVLEVVDLAYSCEPPAAHGGGGRRQVTVRVKGGGTGTLRLVLARRWEGAGSHVDEFEVTVEAQPPATPG